VTVVANGSTIFGGRVVWDNDTPAKCTTCGFIGKVADFEPADSYSPENEEEWEKKIARGDYDLRYPRLLPGDSFLKPGHGPLPARGGVLALVQAAESPEGIGPQAEQLVQLAPREL